MNKKTPTNYQTLTQLSAFAHGLEDDAFSLSKEELDASLEAQGYDLIKMDQSSARLMKRLQNQMRAADAMASVARILKPKISVIDMRIALQSEGHLVAAKAGESLSDEDIEAIYRLTHGEHQEDEAGD